MSDTPCLCLAVDRLRAVDVRCYITWVLRAPYPSGYVLHERAWPAELSQAWAAWQSLFSQTLPCGPDGELPPPLLDFDQPLSEPPMSYSSRLMQHFGIQLWRWLFDDTIRGSLDKSQGIAFGQGGPLRLRLEIRDAALMRLPWEIMQADVGQRAISLGASTLFSRTISEVDPLPPLRHDPKLCILLVVGRPYVNSVAGSVPTPPSLDLTGDVEALTQALQGSSEPSSPDRNPVTCLVEPTPADLIAHLDSSSYNVFIYAGHGAPGPDGGRLFLCPRAELNGMELAQVLTRRQIKLAVFNACWGAQADRDRDNQEIPRSSLAEVLICQGVPAVVGMRDMIADSEALSFIQAFVMALSRYGIVDSAVADARRELLTLYKFNQPTWTLPVLYMHPDFNGQILQPQEDGTEIPDEPSAWISSMTPTAALRTVNAAARECWPIQGGMMRVGKEKDNDLVLQGPGISRRHAEIFYRGSWRNSMQTSAYYLKDFSRFGTFIRQQTGWRCVHNEEVLLAPHTQLKFGSRQNQPLEFIVDVDMEGQ